MIPELEVKRGMKIMVEKEVFNMKRTIGGRLLIETTGGQLHELEDCYKIEEQKLYVHGNQKNLKVVI